VIGRGPTKTSVTVGDAKLGGGKRALINADLRVVNDEQFPFALHYFTGSKAHNVAVRQRAQSQGLKLNEYGLLGPDRNVKCRDEAELFNALGLDYIPPELREDTGEIDAAEKHTLPDLVDTSDLRCDVHMHTTATDRRGW